MGVFPFSGGEYGSEHAGRTIISIFTALMGTYSFLQFYTLPDQAVET